MAKGFAMILVVYGHACTNFGIVNQWICSFFMGLFFVSSGYTYRRHNKLIINNFKRIYVPYLIWGFVGMVYAFAKFYIHGCWQNYNILQKLYLLLLGIGCDNYPLWFLTAFFVSKSIYDTICVIVDSCISQKFIRYRCVIEVVAVSAISLIGYIYTIYKPFGFSILRFDTGLVMLPFFCMGRYLPIALEFLKKRKMMVLAMVSSMVINFITGVLLNDLVSVCSNEYGNILFFYLSTLTGSFAVFILCIYLEKSRIINKLLSHLGKYSQVLMCTHIFILITVVLLLNIIFPGSTNYPMLITSLSLALLYPLLPFLDKLTKSIGDFRIYEYEKNYNS